MMTIHMLLLNSLIITKIENFDEAVICFTHFYELHESWVANLLFVIKFQEQRKDVETFTG